MLTESSPEMRTYGLMGVCLLHVQLAEQGVARAVESILEDSTVKLMEQTEDERSRTLGTFLKKLRRRTRIDPNLNRKLSHFLRMRNTFVHNASEVPGFDIRTEDGREVATKFLVELVLSAMA